MQNVGAFETSPSKPSQRILMFGSGSN